MREEGSIHYNYMHLFPHSKIIIAIFSDLCLCRCNPIAFHYDELYFKNTMYPPFLSFIEPSSDSITPFILYISNEYTKTSRLSREITAPGIPGFAFLHMLHSCRRSQLTFPHLKQSVRIIRLHLNRMTCEVYPYTVHVQSPGLNKPGGPRKSALLLSSFLLAFCISSSGRGVWQRLHAFRRAKFTLAQL
ncbi:unnamed protein product [Albugo candida]|uniref:Uncharacterized protein n=1 Tax=Albugo candida TaxID=65357 RepID=A0A024GIW3_9STRA|nr:unnamed protein product [Albugo candida]|eukprot:CCI46284.1 unnamed protein product [Albugo candida]